MKVTAIMATCGRHSLCERSLSLFLNQTYSDCELIIFQNSAIKQDLSPDVDRNAVRLINQSIDSLTNSPYKTLGAIYRDAFRYISDDTDIVIFWDDDDLFSKDHIEKGVDGFIRGGKKAYKPEYSYFRYDNNISLEANNMEPSIFVDRKHVSNFGFSETTTDQHLNWLNPLLRDDDIFIDSNGKPTLIYNWGDDIFSFKTSADCENPENFDNYRKYSFDHGDRIISPIEIEAVYTMLSSYKIGIL
ncbi:glycosyltransferase family A protein [Sphingobacterium ginsenosidimutans]|uniref:Glycosyltransferase 2-like domain-containing protein n=1 Tax=Sphingobacterium ginsenosidimutans TaxID=687845 RepID=A0ABP7ZQW7_9SPHI